MSVAVHVPVRVPAELVSTTEHAVAATPEPPSLALGASVAGTPAVSVLGLRAGARTGAMLSSFTVVVTGLLALPKLSVAVQVTALVPWAVTVSIRDAFFVPMPVTPPSVAPLQSMPVTTLKSSGLLGLSVAFAMKLTGALNQPAAFGNAGVVSATVGAVLSST
jgi:hypothetical protein